MDAQFEERYRAETRRLVARRGILCATLFAVGAALAGVIELIYHEDRLVPVLLFYGLEVGVCLTTIALFRLRSLEHVALTLTQITCTGLLVCVTLYATVTGASSSAVALLFIVFVLTTALMFPWGGRRQLLMVLVCVGLFYAASRAGTENAIPLAYNLYAVVAGGGISVLGATFLDRQRLMIFRQREQLETHVAALRDLTRTFHGFDPQRILVLMSTSLLKLFQLRRLWAVWRVPSDGPVLGYFAHTGAREEVTYEALPDPEGLWVAAGASWGDTEHACVARGADPRLPGPLRSEGVTAVLCLPIRFDDEIVGAICADRDGAPLGLGDGELQLASMLASGAAIAIANARLYQRVTEASEEKSTFLARIAHELRNPLHTLLWDIDTLQAEAGGAQRILDRLRKNTLMTLEATKELQEFSEVETKRLTARPEQVDLVQLFEDLDVTMMALLNGRPITYRSRVGTGAEAVVADPFRLRQIIGNLLSNAAKFTAEGTIELEAERRGAEVVMSVRDTGIGIEESELATIFAPFYRGSTGRRGPARGMGLGLTIAHEIAGLLHGRIEVESAVGKGSTFRLVLPVGAVEVVRPEAHAAPPTAVDPLVLLIEDDGAERTRAAEWLRRGGTRVIEAGDGFEGLRRARAERPDVIVLDLELPGMSGIDVLGTLKRDRRLSAVPVVMATDHTDPRREAHCREVGCAGYLVKPYAAEDLRTAIAAVAGRAEHHLGTAV